MILIDIILYYILIDINFKQYKKFLNSIFEKNVIFKDYFFLIFKV